ncbi:MAG: general secretion pathway protein GspB [Desulfobacterales bacterium]
MSSILKALKKIDEDTPSAPKIPSLPKTIDAKRSTRSRIRKRFDLHKKYSILLILLVGVGIGVLFLTQKQLILAKLFPTKFSESSESEGTSSDEISKGFQSKPTTKSTKSAKASPFKSQPAKQPPKKIPPKRKSSTNTADDRKYRPPSTTDQRLAKRPSVKKMPETNASAYMPKPVPRQNVLKSRPPANTVVPPKSNPSVYSAPQSVKSTGRQSSPQYSRLSDSKLKLQALAWSADAAQRMVVINGRIVREGESVDGYQINQIREEDVLVNDGRKSWRLEFGLQ